MVGRRIVRVHQQRFYNQHMRSTDVQLDWLELDDGKIIVLHAAEADDGPFVYATVQRPLGSPDDKDA